MFLGNIALLVAAASLSLTFIVSTLTLVLTRRMLLAASLGSASMAFFALALALGSEYSSMLRPCDNLPLRILLVSTPSLLLVLLSEFLAARGGVESTLPLPTRPLPLLALTLLLFAPLGEELVFRGFLLIPLTGLLGNLWALIVSSVVFSLLHSSTTPKSLLPVIFAVGLVMGASVIAWGSLIPSMVSHSILNLQGLLTLWRYRHD